jgi:hypothetical protein
MKCVKGMFSRSQTFSSSGLRSGLFFSGLLSSLLEIVLVRLLAFVEIWFSL